MILVTGTGGQLGSMILETLRTLGAPAEGASRTPSAQGRYMDFDDAETLRFEKVETLVLVSAGYAEDDVVIARHRAVIEAAVRDGVGHLIYTSLTGTGDHLAFALAHRATERIIRDSGINYTILRNGLYAELFGGLFTWNGPVLESAFGEGALSAVTRSDLAEAAAHVASAPQPHRGATYELVGQPLTAQDLAAELGAEHRNLSLSEYRQRLLAADGLLPFQPPMLASIATAVRHGFLNETSPDLEILLAREPSSALPVAATNATLTR